MSDTIIPVEKTVEKIENQILFIRGQKVLLDSTLAELYGVQTRVLNQAVKRNILRFPDDFMFYLNYQEVSALRSQFVTLKLGRGAHRKYKFCVFTEQGVAMLSSVLKSERAIQVNIEIMRAFMRLRQMISSNKILAKKVEELESKVGKHNQAINSLFEAIHEMMNPPEEHKKKIGFNSSI